MEHGLSSIAIFKYSHQIGSPCSIEKVEFENIIFQHYQSLNSHNAGGCSSENRLLNFDILMHTYLALEKYRFFISKLYS